MNPMKNSASALVSLTAGLLFALGLGISGMTNPHKVIGFLDLTGNWDYDLAFVMAAALAVYVPAYRIYDRRGRKPVVSKECGIPSTTRIDGRLLLGSALFGVGWALGGYCPGPALTSLASGTTEIAVFLVAMIAGIAGTRTFLSR